LPTAVQSEQSVQSPPLSAIAKRWAPYASVVVATAGLAAYVVREVLKRCGHPAVPLDDAFIHFQYARRLAGGHFFSYVEGEGYSSGATSLLWPTLLAPLYLIGLRDLTIIWAAWGLGFLALGALAVETYRLAAPLAGRVVSIGAGAMVLCFGGYVWCAASGMEVVPLAWVLAFALRQCIEWGESPENERTPPRRRLLLVISLVAPLLRPEGMLASLLIFATLAFFPAASQANSPQSSVWRRRAPALLALVGPLVLPLLNLALTGHAASSTTMVKWLPGNPYYGQGWALVAAVQENARIFFETLLDGKEWSAIYVPSGAKPYAIAGLLAIPVAGALRGRLLRAGLVLVMAISILVPCTYLTFLWNRLRYLWPFAFAWFIGLSCLGYCVGELLASIRPQLRAVGAVVSLAFAGALASHLGWTIDDVVGSASAIDRQQVALARWADATLPPEARIGVNDTGAIGYLSNRRTFDVVGLTTPGEARYWVAGAGSRFEHYERLGRASLDRLPTHFIVYRHWMACDAVLGDELHAETVTDQTILGGTTMTAFSARYDLLGSGDAPSATPQGKLIDELDVADLESEALHDYEIGVTRESDNQALSYDLDDRIIADGARVGRLVDQFTLQRGRRGAAFVVARLVADVPTDVEVHAGTAVVATLHLVEGGWSERRFDLPGDSGEETIALSLRAREGGRFGSAHYWLYEK